MKFLALSDAHGVYTHIPQLLLEAGEIDAICVIGDITDFGPNALVEELLSIIGEDVPTLMIPGNCDLPTIVETIEESPAVNLHLKSFDYNNIRFLGIGGSNPTPFNTPFELSEAELQSYAAKLLHEVAATTVLLSHTPPKGFLDTVGATHVGSEAIRGAVGIVDVIACGHIHEQRGVVVSGKTTIVNPGMAARGSGAVIEIQPGESPAVTLLQS
ncbi:MAG TPA: metallophosphoesterase family protein [Candidatus Bathyarchaeia archaeon]|nr:metallophosphoesterase family protein [Candidatus Bathyarchaeia archaeon]